MKCLGAPRYQRHIEGIWLSLHNSATIVGYRRKEKPELASCVVVCVALCVVVGVYLKGKPKSKHREASIVLKDGAFQSHANPHQSTEKPRLCWKMGHATGHAGLDPSTETASNAK